MADDDLRPAGDEAHLRWLSGLVEAKRKEYDQASAKLAQMKGHADKLFKELKELNNALQLVRRSLGMETSGRDPFAFKNMTVADAAYVIMKENGEQMRVTDLLRLLKDGGKQLKSENAYSVVVTALGRDDKRFTKVRKGVFKLTE